MPNKTQAASPHAVPSDRLFDGLPTRTTVIEREIALARRQLSGYTRSLHYEGRTLGEEVEPPAQGELREKLLAEIGRLERHLDAMSTPVLMPDLVLHDAPESARMTDHRPIRH